MENNIIQPSSRRGFIRDILFTLSVMLVTMRIGANKNRFPDTISCGAVTKPSPNAIVTSVKSGKWSDPATWGGKLPANTDTPVIASGHDIVFDMAETTVAGVNVSDNAKLTFDPGKSSLLKTSKNVLVEGKLEMRPNGFQVTQTLRFINVNEKVFVGGGMNVIETDVGLWIMGNGVTNIMGTEKTSWTRAKAGIVKGSTGVEVEENNEWQDGDEISIAPTEAPTVGEAFVTGFDEAKLLQGSGNQIKLSRAVSHAHPKVNDKWTAEIMNLTRNVRIEGTEEGRAHIFIRSTAKQSIQYAAFRYLGPRKDKNGDGVTELVAGRYGLHFHHCMDGSRGSVVKGNVIRDTNNHCYVPHVSHEITFIDNISYNTLETSFWWDPGDSTHETVYDHNIVARCNFLRKSINMNGEDSPTFSSSGFALNTGDGNICNNNVVVAGGQGDFADGGAYNWEAVINEGVWIFQGNLAHNNGCGLRVWQNSTRNHIVEDYFAYYNLMGLFHGAYANSYTYNGGILFGNGIQIKAASVNSNRVRIENIEINGAGLIDNGVEIIHSPLPGERPVLLRNLTISGCRVAAIIDTVEPEVHSVDVLQCDLQGDIILHPQAAQNEVIRVQPKTGNAFQITKDGTTTIEPFAPTYWGTGKGLKGEYFNSADFTNPAFTRIDSNISFTEWSAGVHYAIRSNTYSVRWTGKIQPQLSEEYTIAISAGGGYRLWIDGKLILENWKENVSGTFAAKPLAMEAGKLYDIKVEYFNTENSTGMGLSWSSAGTLAEYVPQSQLYAGDVSTDPDPPPPPPPPPTDPPPANSPQVTTTAHDYIEVRTVENTLFVLYDEAGRVLKRGSLTQGLNLIYVSTYSNGILLLKLNNVKKAFKIMKI